MQTENNNKIVTRFAPSPTGNLHLGGVRTALFSFLYARNNNGKFILRIEDTDKERSKKEFEKNILEGLAWLGISYDEIYRQSERTEIYKKYIQQLIDKGLAYVSQEEVKKEGDRSEVIRFKNPNKIVTFSDEIRGEVTFDTTELGDFVIARDIDNPLYHFVVVVDDFEMGVTHVIRGEDHISNTPRQILIQEAIGATLPIYAHIPLILAPDRTKLSKRHGAVSVVEYEKMGYLPQALINFLALIGWNPGDEREIFSMDELIEAFSLERVQKGGGIFNLEKLDWINKQHIAKMSPERALNKVKEMIPKEILSLPQYSEERLVAIVPIITERISKFNDVIKMTEDGEIDYFFKTPEYDVEKLLWKKNPDPVTTKQHLDKVIELLSNINSKNFTQESVKESVWEYAEKEGRGDVLWPMRFALCGREKSPDPLTLSQILGKEETLNRLSTAVNLLDKIQ